MVSGSIAPPSLTSALDGVDWPFSRCSHFPCGGKPSVGPQGRCEGYGNDKNLLPLPGLETQFLGRLAHITPVYRLSYPGSEYLTLRLLNIDGQKIELIIQFFLQLLKINYVFSIAEKLG
jgi:hypothetical protein